MTLTFTVTVVLRHVRGAPENQDCLASALLSDLGEANPCTIIGDNEGEYRVDSWDVEYEEPERKR